MINTRLLPVVAAALLGTDGRVLLARRPAGKSFAGSWEFPGGKVEPDETPEVALARELTEELGIAADPAAMAPVAFASAPAGDRHLVLLLYLIRAWHGEPRAIEADAIAWVRPGDMHTLPMPPADVPLVDALIRVISPGR